MTSPLASLSSPALSASAGLPVHPLIVHAAVVLLPLSLLGMVAAVLVPRLRPRLAGLSLLGLAAGAASVWLAEESGESLADRVGLPKAHAEYGELMPVAAIAALLLAAIWWRLQRGPDLPRLPSWSQRAAAVAVIAVAVPTLGLTVLTGHSGAVAVWEDDDEAAAAGPSAPVAATSPSSGNPTGAPSSGSGGRTMAEVARHNSRTDCWSVVDGKVYNLTSWIARHPGGQAVVVAMCGVDASAAFRGKHGTSSGPGAALAGLALGPLATGGPAVPSPTATAAAAPTTRYTRAQVARHNRVTDCWSTVRGKVYDLTQWVARHPGGREAIAEMCGTDGAGEYLEQHAGDAAAGQVLAGYQIGVLV